MSWELRKVACFACPTLLTPLPSASAHMRVQDAHPESLTRKVLYGSGFCSARDAGWRFFNAQITREGSGSSASAGEERPVTLQPSSPVARVHANTLFQASLTPDLLSVR